jgi:WhiB family redox-sensing transcriptional regulator
MSADFMADGLCAQTDPEAFFPEKGGSVRDAKAICRRCPVIAACLDYALASDERFGVWGGMSERERHALRREQPAPTHTITRQRIRDQRDAVARLAAGGTTPAEIGRALGISTRTVHRYVADARKAA